MDCAKPANTGSPFRLLLCLLVSDCAGGDGNAVCHNLSGCKRESFFLGGQWTVTANAYFIPHFGPGSIVNVGPDPFVWIDAFDIQLGDFIRTISWT